jgi:hypothetical protein
VGTDVLCPIGFPALAATALHLDLVSAWSFPIRVVGLVHPGFVIECVADLPVDQPWDISAWIDGHRHVRSGLEFDLRAQVSVAGTVRWQCRAVTLARSARASGPEASATPRAHLPEHWDHEVPMAVPGDIGRRFGRFSGDMNLIHLHPLTARLFGFDQPIAHGWWLAGRISALLGLAAAEPGRELRVAFRRPVPVPSVPQLGWSVGPAGTTFALDLPGADRPAVTGVITSHRSLAWEHRQAGSATG